MLKKTVKLTELSNGHAIIALDNFSDFIDISKAAYYELVPVSDGSLQVLFYDAGQNVIKPYN